MEQGEGDADQAAHQCTVEADVLQVGADAIFDLGDERVAPRCLGDRPRLGGNPQNGDACGLKSVRNADVGECDVVRGAGVLQEASGEEAGEVDRDRRMRIERPAELEVDLIADVSRAASAARPNERTTDLI